MNKKLPFHAVMDEENTTLLRIQVGHFTNHPDGVRVGVRIYTHPDEAVYCLERNKNKGRLPLPPKWFLDGVEVIEGEVTKLHFYNQDCLIAIGLRRDNLGQVSYDVLKKGKFIDLYQDHHRVLLARHGTKFSDFEDQQVLRIS